MRKLNSNKTQILQGIRLCKYEPNVPLRDERPEGNLQPDEEIVIPQDDLYVITWEINFGDLQADHRNETYDQNHERNTNSSDASEAVQHPDQILTDMDLRSTGRTTTDEVFPNPISQDDAQSFTDDKTSSGGSDTIVPEVLESEDDDMIVENERPREGKYSLRPNPQLH